MKNIHEENGVDRNVYLYKTRKEIRDLLNVTKFQKSKIISFFLISR